MEPGEAVLVAQLFDWYLEPRATVYWLARRLPRCRRCRGRPRRSSGDSPKDFFQVGKACSFSNPRSRSWRPGPPVTSAPSPQSARRLRPAPRLAPRAAARVARIACSARGRSPARTLTSRDTTGSDATGQASPGCSRSTAISARQSPPSATAAARSATTLPGSCAARGARHRASPSARPRPRPVTRIVSYSRTAPSWDTSPLPSADTATRVLRALFFT